MKVICIKNTYEYKQFDIRCLDITIGKVYDVNIDNNNIFYNIITDGKYIAPISKEYFMTIDQYRLKQLNTIIQ